VLLLALPLPPGSASPFSVAGDRRRRPLNNNIGVENGAIQRASQETTERTESSKGSGAQPQGYCCASSSRMTDEGGLVVVCGNK